VTVLGGYDAFAPDPAPEPGPAADPWCPEDPCAVAALTWQGRFEPLAAILRGPAVESVHCGAVAVSDTSGRLLGGAGDPGVPVDLRSAAKPFQALALLESGAAEEFGLSDEELAVVCASHSGEPHHVRLVAALLEKAGAEPGQLVCGAQAPIDRATRAALTGPPSTLHNMCSGKHAGMLLLARRLGAPMEGYHLPDHPVQQRIAESVACLLGVPAEGLFLGTDGCGVPVIRLPLLLGARLYALLADGASPGLRRLRDAMTAHPRLVAGEGRFDTQAIEFGGGSLLAKSGAEGVEGLALVGDGVGALMKVSDGSARAIPVLAGDLLLAWGRPEGQEFRRMHSPIYSRAGEPVGRISGLVDEGRLRRAPGEPKAAVTERKQRLVVLDGRERDVNRFRREQWPRADEEILGATYDWTAGRLSLGVREGRDLVGLLSASFIGGVATVEELIVREDRRGRGVGGALLHALEHEARARGAHKVVLRTPLGARAEGFYLQHGFRRECLFARHHFGHHYLSLRKDLE
jgi:L-asparaginase II/GNAT superfamily N-acetyltransferase